VGFGDAFVSDKDKSNLTFKEIVLKAIENCRIEGSKQMVKGGEVTVLVEGQPTRVTQRDQRKVFEEATETLYDLLNYYIKDKKILEDLEDKKQKEYDSLLKNYKEITPNERLKTIASKGTFPRDPSSEYFLQLFEDFKISLVREKFRFLIKVFKTNNELKQAVYTEGDYDEDEEEELE